MRISVENSHASEVTSVDAPTPPRVPMTAAEMWRLTPSSSPARGAVKTACAWLSESRSMLADNGFNR